MRAAVLRSPGPVDTNPLHVEELPMPVPADNEVLLKVLAAGARLELRFRVVVHDGVWDVDRCAAEWDRWTAS